MNSAKTSAGVRKALQRHASPARKTSMERFFKTGPGEYGEGDVFLGVTVPDQRRVARAFRGLPLAECRKLLASEVHEERLTALLILVDAYAHGSDLDKRAIVDFYLANIRRVNNWDLVDSSAAQILGDYLVDKNHARLRKLATSHSLWERRIAIIATFAFIHSGEHRDTFEIALMLLEDEHDLIHKAVGWMLREVGKRVDVSLLRAFLREHARRMPRTALRYAIEHLPAGERQRFMKQK